MNYLLKFFYVVGAICAGLLMAAMFGAGFWELAAGVRIFFGLMPSPQAGARPESEAIVVALKGIEYLFLAPMGFLVFQAIVNYVTVRRTHPVGQELKNAEAAVADTKALVINLMIAVVATDLVGRALAPDSPTTSPPVYELVLFSLLIGYLAVLHWLSPKGDRPAP